MAQWSALMRMLFLLLLCFAARAIARIDLVDDSGAPVRLDAPAKRIVSLAPHATELLYAAGLGPALVGVSAYSDYPPAARALPSVGSLSALDLERIVGLKPDLVVAWGSGGSPAATSALRRMGIAVFVSDPRALADIAANLRKLGQLGGQPAQGEAAAHSFESGLAELRARYAGRRELSVFYQIWDEPLITVNGSHSLSEVLRLCGGRNVFADLPALAPTVSLESVLGANPQVIFASGSDAQRPPFLDHWRRWPQLRAALGGALYDIPPDLVQRPTPRLLEGATRICAALDAARNQKPGF
jgi:iron complex transport system substrate-binding protein